MATISGKRFQITDGASTPTNLFPYTVTEAVYGLSTVIEAAKTAVTNSLTAVTLNGVSKAGTTASFYAPAASGTTGQILKATTSGAPVWTSAALGAENKPIYLNSSGVLTEGVACVKTSGDTMTGPLTITGSADTLLAADTAHSTASYIRLRYNTGGTAVTGYIGLSNGKLVYYSGGDKEIWHAGNSNKSDVAWACSTLTANGIITSVIEGGGALHLYGTGRNAGCGSIIFQSRSIAENGAKISCVNETSYSRSGIAFYTSNDAAWTQTWVERMRITCAGNVGIGTTSPEYKLDVNGVARCRYVFFLTTDGTSNAGYVGRGGASTNNLQLTAASGNGLGLGANGSDNTIFIDTSSNVGIGTASPGSKLDVDGAIKCASIYVNRGVSETATGIGFWGTNSITSYGLFASTTTNYGTFGAVSGDFAVYFTMSGSAVGRGWMFKTGSYGIVASISQGGILTTKGDQVVSSDASLKTNLKDVTYSVSDIAACRAVTFDWKDGRGHSAGSIAQDWKPLIPELVHGEEGNMTLAYGQIALVNTIIEAREIDALKKRVAELEAEVQRLRMN